MLTPAHIAASYLLSQVPSVMKIPITSSEVAAIVLAGNILDLDFLFGTLLGKRGDDHHNFITHTPIFSFTAWMIGYILFSSYFSQLAWIMILVSMLLHLVLDDIGYWFYKLGWQQISKYPQINWLYPLKDFHKRIIPQSNNMALKEYLTKARVNLIVETSLITAALFVFLT